MTKKKKCSFFQTLPAYSHKIILMPILSWVEVSLAYLLAIILLKRSFPLRGFSRVLPLCAQGQVPEVCLLCPSVMPPYGYRLSHSAVSSLWTPSSLLDWMLLSHPWL